MYQSDGVHSCIWWTFARLGPAWRHSRRPLAEHLHGSACISPDNLSANLQYVVDAASLPSWESQAAVQRADFAACRMQRRRCRHRSACQHASSHSPPAIYTANTPQRVRGRVNSVRSIQASCHGLIAGPLPLLPCHATRGRRSRMRRFPHDALLSPPPPTCYLGDIPYSHALISASLRCHSTARQFHWLMQFPPQ